MRGLRLIQTTLFNVPQIIDITDQLPRKAPWESIKKKYTVKGHWDGKTWHTGFRKPEDITTIVIHHSGSPEGTLEGHASYHGRKWGGGIAYHIAIDKGLIKQCNNLLSFTYHAGGHNTYTVAIMVNRDLSKGDLTSVEREMLYAAILSVKAVLPIKFIKGHNEVCPTQCPATSMNKIRQDIAALELQMAVTDTPNDQLAKVVALRARVEDLYKTSSVPGKYQAEALRKMAIVSDAMKQQGLM